MRSPSAGWSRNSNRSPLPIKRVSGIGCSLPSRTYEAWRATDMRDKKLSAPPADSQLVETRIGSGSDHTVFLNHLGRPDCGLGERGARVTR